MPRDEDYSREKLERFFPTLHRAVVEGVRESMDEYRTTAHKHRITTRRSITRDHIVDHLRGNLLLDPQVSFKDRNQTTYLEICGEFRLLAKMADGADHVSLNSNQASFAYQENDQADIFASEDLPEATNLYLSYVPNSREPRDPFVFLICPKAGGYHWRFEIVPPAVELAGEVGTKPSPAPENAEDADDLIRIPAPPKPEESE